MQFPYLEILKPIWQFKLKSLLLVRISSKFVFWSLIFVKKIFLQKYEIYLTFCYRYKENYQPIPKLDFPYQPSPYLYWYYLYLLYPNFVICNNVWKSAATTHSKFFLKEKLILELYRFRIMLAVLSYWLCTNFDILAHCVKY